MKKEELHLLEGYSYTTENIGNEVVYIIKDENNNIIFQGNKEDATNYNSMILHNAKRDRLKQDCNDIISKRKKLKETRIKNLVISSGAVLVLTVPFIVTGSMALISLPVIGTATFLFSQKFIDARYFDRTNEMKNYYALLEQEDEVIKTLENKLNETKKVR